MAAWKKGRGKLGPLAPLIGVWRAQADSEMGPVACTRAFERFGDQYVRLDAEWEFEGDGMEGRIYREVCLFGVDPDTGALGFWSYTNDGKRSSGRLSEAPEIHPQAVCFEAQMSHGVARQVYWPGEDDDLVWAVDAKKKSGWRRMAQHHYSRSG